MKVYYPFLASTVKLLVCDWMKTISTIRASVVNSLNDMVDNGILDYDEKTGKGGHHRVYSHKYSETQRKEHLASRLIRKLLKEFPDETRRALSQLA